MDTVLARDAPSALRCMTSLLPSATAAVWSWLTSKLPVSPAKPHYSFDLHAVSSVFSALLRSPCFSTTSIAAAVTAAASTATGTAAAGGTAASAAAAAAAAASAAAAATAVVSDYTVAALTRVWRHECWRAFGDQLCTLTDRAALTACIDSQTLRLAQALLQSAEGKGMTLSAATVGTTVGTAVGTTVGQGKGGVGGELCSAEALTAAACEPTAVVDCIGSSNSSGAVSGSVAAAKVCNMRTSCMCMQCV
jgi:trimeric autotransporter adhesin